MKKGYIIGAAVAVILVVLIGSAIAFGYNSYTKNNKAEVTKSETNNSSVTDDYPMIVALSLSGELKLEEDDNIPKDFDIIPDNAVKIGDKKFVLKSFECKKGSPICSSKYGLENEKKNEVTEAFSIEHYKTNYNLNDFTDQMQKFYEKANQNQLLTSSYKGKNISYVWTTTPVIIETTNKKALKHQIIKIMENKLGKGIVVYIYAINLDIIPNENRKVTQAKILEIDKEYIPKVAAIPTYPLYINILKKISDVEKK